MTSIAQTWAGSLRVRLTVGYVLVVAVLAGAWGWSLAGPLTEAAVDQHRSTLTSVAQAGALVLAETDVDAQTIVDRLVARTRIRMTVVGSDGTVLADSEEDAAAMDNHADRPEVAAALDGETGEDRRVSETQGTERVYIAVPASLDGQRVALRVSESIDHIDAIASRSRSYGLWLLLLAALIAAAIGLRLSAATVQPVTRLSSAARGMARGDLTTPVPQERGDLGVLSGALTDLREQMRTRLADLEAGQRNLREVLDGLTDAVFLLEGTRVRFANATAKRLFPGCDLSSDAPDIYSCGLPASALAVIIDAHGTVSSAESGPDPTGRHLRVTVLPLAPDDGSGRRLVVATDITERVNIDRMRRDFVANASHELKTPAAAIRLLSESTATAASDGDVGQAVTFAAQIAPEAERLSRLVGDLLDLSRLESTTTPGAITDVRASITNALLSHKAAAQRAGLELEYTDRDASGVDAYAAADPTDLAIALDNLLDNAIAYTEHGRVSVRLAADDSHVTIAVTDTGPGIPAADLSRIFERFYRVDRARSRESGGTGLGLALVRHVVERSSGRVDVQSQEGVGSTFTMVFPRAT